jgi:hypothetical protein
MDTERVRMEADELAWLAARLNRRSADMEAMEPDSQDFRDAVLVSDLLAQEITAAVRKLLASTA